MAPVKLLCYEFLTTLLSNKISKPTKVQDQQNDNSVYDIDDSSDVENGEINDRVEERKEWSRRENMANKSLRRENEEMHKRLNKMLTEEVKFNLSL